MLQSNSNCVRAQGGGFLYSDKDKIDGKASL